MKSLITYILLLIIAISCIENNTNSLTTKNPQLVYKNYIPKTNDIVISRAEYFDKLEGFWLGQCIANWTGLVTEMDKIGNIGEIKTGDFYTREDWQKPDKPSIWGEGIPSNLSDTIDFVFRGTDTIWGADDDTDIEYMYQHLLYTNNTSSLTPTQIRNGWLKHIKKDEENYLWVSNQKAFDLMQKGMLPPNTSLPKNNEHFEMIDAQLTTEIFGLFSPTRPDKAIEIAYLPIRTVARENAAHISEFYVTLHSLAATIKKNTALSNQLTEMAISARNQLPNYGYAAKMFDFVYANYLKGIPWEVTRDMVYEHYQVNEEDGYTITSKNLYCNGCFAAGINFAASLISYFYGEGNIKETIKIATLCGWDSDNPAATWGGLLGFIYGRKAIEKEFNYTFSNKFNIHRTRQNFPNNGLDTFENMAQTGVFIIDKIIQEELNGGVDLKNNLWYIPKI